MIATRLNQPKVSGATTQVRYLGQIRRVFIGDVIDQGEAPIKEVRLLYPTASVFDPRILRLFHLKNGDVAFRAYGSGFADTKLADRLFDTRAGALVFLDTETRRYYAAGWQNA